MTTLLTPQQVADRLKISVLTVYKWAEAGRLPSLKVGSLLRVRESELEAWLNKENPRPKQKFRAVGG